MFNFLTSTAFQKIGIKLGLDQDGDGDVDPIDLVFFVGKTGCGRWGEFMAKPARVLAFRGNRPIFVLAGMISFCDISFARIADDERRSRRFQ